MKSHAAVPIAAHIADDYFRIYFSSRDSLSRAHTGYIVIDLARPEHILELSQKPVLSPANLEFDDSGAMATWLTNFGEKRMLYYQGWNLGVTVPFRNSIGLAIADRHGPFERFAKGLIMDRTPWEPHFCASSCVLQEGNLWRMWYLSCVEWLKTQNTPRHRYHIKYAESSNGSEWKRHGLVAVDFSGDDEYAISRPSVIRDAELWRMWFSHRGRAYQIGYAESGDGFNWIRRDDDVGIGLSETGWDSEMIEYPFVFDHRGRRYMLYNGNGYGKTGFGLAVGE